MISDQGQQLVQYLAEIAGAPVYRAESKRDPQYAPLIGNVRAFNDGTSIVLRPEIVDNLLRLQQVGAGTQIDPSMQLWKNTARDLYAFAHEMGHFRKGILDGDPAARQRIEDASNTWAFNHLKPLARRMGLSKAQAQAVYQALPAKYRAWHAGNRWSPDVMVPPKRLGG